MLKNRWDYKKYLPFLIHPKGFNFDQIENEKLIDISKVKSGDVVALEIMTHFQLKPCLR